MASQGLTTRLNTYEGTTKKRLRNGQTTVRSVRARETTMYDERINDPALALMELGVPFCLLGVRMGFWTARLYGGLVGGKMYQHRHTCRRLLSFSLGGTGNVPVEAPGST